MVLQEETYPSPGADLDQLVVACRLGCNALVDVFEVFRLHAAEALRLVITSCVEQESTP